MFTAPLLGEHEKRVLAEIEKLAQKLQLHVRGRNRWTGALRWPTFARNVQGSNSIEGTGDVSAAGLGYKWCDVDPFAPHS